ncbi:transient receptor potential channel pyrexia-like [Panulirus ornatus]|uniref:transient receptor potential channel pyrexia-like n=1 Tax=Panulirus ornatus TaxID=150431 RepID=UPI003A864974
MVGSRPRLGSSEPPEPRCSGGVVGHVHSAAKITRHFHSCQDLSSRPSASLRLFGGVPHHQHHMDSEARRCGTHLSAPQVNVGHDLPPRHPRLQPQKGEEPWTSTPFRPEASRRRRLSSGGRLTPSPTRGAARVVGVMNGGVVVGKANQGVVNNLNHGVVNNVNQGVVSKVNQGVVSKVNQGVVSKGNQGVLSKVNKGIVNKEKQGLVNKVNTGVVNKANQGKGTKAHHQGVATKGHPGLTTCLSWSSARTPPSPQQQRRPRVYTESHGQPPPVLSRSLRIKQWIQARQRSSSQENTQHSYVTVDEADEDGRPLGRYLENISEENETARPKERREKKPRRRVSALTTRRRRQWRSDVGRDISPSSETSDENFEKSTNIEGRLLEVSVGWNAQAVREHHVNALRSFLSAKNQPLVVLNLLEANRVAEAVALARESQTRVLLDACLLWACLQGAADLVRTMLEAGANVDARDNAGFSALHLAAESGSEEVLGVLMEGGARIGDPWDWDGNEEVTPLMLAARSGCVGGVQALIASGMNVNAGINTSGDTALHHAVRAAAPDCVQVLINSGAILNPTLLYSETSLHIAVCEGLSDIVDILLAAGADVKASRGNSKMTALHIAAQEGMCSVAHQLLKAGANPNRENLRGQTPLHLAAKSQSSDTVQLLLSFGADPTACDRDHKTPLHSGIFKGSRSHECLRLLLEAGADANAADQLGYTPLHMAALHDSSYCVLLFLHYGGDVTACTQGGVSALNLIIRRTPTVLAHIQENLDAAISFTDHDQQERDSQVQMDFRVLVPGDGYGLECRMLSCFIREGQKPLLKHPLCETLLFLKWLRVRSFFVFNLVFYALLVAMLTCYIMVVFPASSCIHLNSTTSETILAPFQMTPTYVKVDHNEVSTPQPRSNPTNSSVESTGKANDTPPVNTARQSKREQCGLHYQSVLVYLLYFIWAGVGMLAVKETFQVVDAPRTYMSSWDNVLVWPIITFTATITITSYIRYDTQEWEHHLAAIVILLSWVELLLLIGRFPVFGLYVQMFTHVTQNFGKFLFAYLSLINAFSLSFGVLFPNHAPFKLYALRFVKTLVMMTGEIEYDEWFYDESKTIMYPGTSHIIFLIFLIFVTIILMNLLVGLAVSDIQGLQKSAGLDRLVRQTELIAHFESIMFSEWLAWAMPKGVLRLLHRRILLCPSLYGWTLVINPKTRQDTGLPHELLEVILRTARARDHVSRRRNAFANFRTMSKAAQYSSDADCDVHRSIDALRFGLDLLVWDVDERRENRTQLKESLATLTEEVARLGKCVDALADDRACPTCHRQEERSSVYTSCGTLVTNHDPSSDPNLITHL